MANSGLQQGLIGPAFRFLILGFMAITACLAAPLYPQAQPHTDASGDWIAVFGDSVSVGTLAFHLAQDDIGRVTGDYQTTLGGVGIAAGQVDGNRLSLTLTETQAQCPGAYRGSVTLVNEAGNGTFTGKDCLGFHDDGVLSIHRKGAVAAPPLSIPHDKDGNVQPYTLLYENGQPFWISHSESALVAVAASEVDGYLRLTVLVSNSSEEPVTLFPEAIEVKDVISGKSLPYTSPEKVARKIEHRAAFAAALMAFGSGLQAYSNSMVTVHTTGTLSMYDNQGNWAQGSYYGTAQARVPVDTARLRAQNAQESALIAARANRTIAALTGNAMRSQTLAPQTYMVGNVLFPRAKVENLKKVAGRDFKSYFVKVIVPVGAENFMFLFPVELLQALPHQ